MDDMKARVERFENSTVAQEHKKIRDEIVKELHLDFERRENGTHAVCLLCRGSVAQLTQVTSYADSTRDAGVEFHEHGYVFTLDGLASLFMTHFMQKHYEQEGRTS